MSTTKGEGQVISMHLKGANVCRTLSTTCGTSLVVPHHQRYNGVEGETVRAYRIFVYALDLCHCSMLIKERKPRRVQWVGTCGNDPLRGR